MPLAPCDHDECGPNACKYDAPAELPVFRIQFSKSDLMEHASQFTEGYHDLGLLHKFIDTLFLNAR